jgi:hypothetical protein
MLETCAQICSKDIWTKCVYGMRVYCVWDVTRCRIAYGSLRSALYIAKWHIGLLVFGFEGSFSLIFSAADCLPITLFEQTHFDGYKQDLLVILLLFVCLF